MTIEIRVDPTNPGHYFAACGLFELATRMGDGNETGRFSGHIFRIATRLTLSSVLGAAARTGFSVLADEGGAGDDDDEEASDAAAPLWLGDPFGLVLDWWTSPHGKELKLWAGTMNGPRIAQAMLAALADDALHTTGILDAGMVVFDPASPSKKVEPFYFDARRAGNASSLDVGFAPNDLKLETQAFPAVEVLCLIGLQRFRPHRVERRIFEYTTWQVDVPLLVAPALCAGHGVDLAAKTYRFESWFRTSQRKHKAFKTAILRPEGDMR